MRVELGDLQWLGQEVAGVAQGVDRINAKHALGGELAHFELENLADFFTKAQSPGVFKAMRDRIMNVKRGDGDEATGGS